MAFAFLAFYGPIQKWQDEFTMGSSIGWPKPIVSLSPEPGTVEAPGVVNYAALVLDAGVAVICTVGSGLFAKQAFGNPTALGGIRVFLLVVGLLGTWLAVLRAEMEFARLLAVVFEFCRLWAMISMALSWYAILNKRKSRVAA
jgi:hypothetical protein